MPGPARMEGGASADDETEKSNKSSGTNDSSGSAGRARERAEERADDDSSSDGGSSSGSSSGGSPGGSPGRARQRAEEDAEESVTESDDSSSGSSPGRARQQVEEASDGGGESTSGDGGTGGGDDTQRVETPSGVPDIVNEDHGSVSSEPFQENYIEKGIERRTGEDVEVDVQDDGDVEVTRESSGRYGTGAARNKAQAAQTDVKRSGLSETVLKRQAKQAEKRLEKQYSGLDINVGYTESGDLTIENVEQKEQFGDAQLNIPFTGGKSVEDYLEAGSEDISQGIRDTSSALFDEGGVASESIIAEGLEAAGQEEAAAVFEENLRSFGKGTFEGAANLTNVPSVALGLKEAGEFLGYAGSKTLAGEGGNLVEVSDANSVNPAEGKFAVGPSMVDVDLLEGGVAGQTEDALASAGVSAVDAAQSNPAKFSGQLVGSLAGSYGAMSAAPKSAYFIQPGEEIVGSLATRAASKTATGSRLISKMPGDKIDNEELAIYAGKKAGKKLRNAVDDPRVKQFLRDDRAQGQLTLTKERTETESEETSETDEELSDLDKELERIREEVSKQDVRETDEWTPDETETEAETESTPTEDVRETLIREEQGSVQEVAESTPRTDVRESLTTELGQSEVGVEPGSKSKDLDQTVREIAEVEQELQQKFDLETETEAEAEVGRLEATTLEETTTLQDLQQEVQTDLDSTFTEVEQETSVETAAEFFQEVETEMDTELDTEFKTEFEQEFETEFEQEVKQEVESEFERETEREKEPFGEEDPNADGFFEDETDWETFSKEYENPVTSLEDAGQVFEDTDREMEGIFE